MSESTNKSLEDRKLKFFTVWIEIVIFTTKDYYREAELLL